MCVFRVCVHAFALVCSSIYVFASVYLCVSTVINRLHSSNLTSTKEATLFPRGGGSLDVKLRRLFNLLDYDNNNKIEFQEFLNAIGNLFPPFFSTISVVVMNVLNSA